MTDGLLPKADPLIVASALRKAVMARVQRRLGPDTPLPTYFSGHRPDGTRALQQEAPHLAFAFDPGSHRAFVLAPHALERREATDHEASLQTFLASAMSGFHELRAGRAGLLVMEDSPAPTIDDRVLGTSRGWRSATDYVVNRHAKKRTAHEIIADDVIDEALRAGLPIPEVTVREAHGVEGVGLVGRLELTFQGPVPGPILLGRTRHKGGGLFVALTTPSQ